VTDWKKAAQEHLARREHPKAVEAFRAALLENPDDLDAREGLGCALASAGRPADALAELDRVVKVDATRARTRRARSEALMRLGRFDAAIEEQREAMRLEEQGSKDRRGPSRM
jgi:Flp pilus assembly protein TadD